jgi:hypothetical protein
MSVVKIYNKQRDITYVYESVSYWDKEKKQPRSQRKLIGKLDPVTGEVVPTGKRGKAQNDTALHSDTGKLSDLLALKEKEILNLKQQIEALKQENLKYRKLVSQLGDIIDKAR